MTPPKGWLAGYNFCYIPSRSAAPEPEQYDFNILNWGPRFYLKCLISELSRSEIVVVLPSPNEYFSGATVIFQSTQYREFPGSRAAARESLSQKW